MVTRGRSGLAIAAAWLFAAAASAAEPALDYDFFKARVEPIFLKKRPDHARCYSCHSDSNNAFRLEKLSPGAKFWDEAQSRRNFEMATHIAFPGHLMESPLLRHPLAPEGGGDAYHSGGRQFANKNDPDWKTLAQWVSGKTLRAGK